MYDPHSGEPFIALIRISHPGFSEPLRFANSREDVMSRGELYDGQPFDVRYPPQVEGQEATLEVVAQNVDRTVEAALAALTSEPTFVHEVVLASNPDRVELGPFRLPLRSSRSSMGQLVLVLGGGNPILQKAFPRAYFNAADFPGLSRI
jgi:hypothetical protein